MIVDRPEQNKLAGFYRGKVVKHLSHGKCKVFIPGVYSSEWESAPDNLPSAEQAAPLFGPSNGGGGVFSYPNLGTTVWCFFANGDQNYPVFFAATLGGEEAEACYDEARPNVSKDTLADGSDAYVHKLDAHNTTVKIWESGYVELIVRSDQDDADQCRVDIDGKGNVIVSSTQQVQVDSPNIRVTAADQLQMTANTIKVTAASELDVITPQLVSMNGLSFNVQSPSINLDATSGAAAIKGKRHTAFYN